MASTSPSFLARLSVSEDDPEKRAGDKQDQRQEGSGREKERAGDLSFFPYQIPVVAPPPPRFFNPLQTESLEQAVSFCVGLYCGGMGLLTFPINRPKSERKSSLGMVAFSN